MSLSVNVNVASLNAQRNLGISSTQLNKSLERLSSGFRINRAGDDAAGLAISETLRSQIRGLNQAVRNANDGQSLVNTAEGVLNESTNIVQRIRELSIQAANGTNSDANRASIQDEVDQLVSELNRIGNTTQFNGRNLLDGSFNTVLQIGANRNQTLAVAIDDVRASALGAVAEVNGGALTATASTDLDDIRINGTLIATPAAADDTASTVQNATSAIALAAAINASSGTTKVTAEVEAAAKVGSAAAGGGTLDGTNSLTINGVAITGTFVANDTDGALVAAINAAQNQTGVVATNSSGTLTLTADDGRNIQVVTAGTGHTISGLNASATTTVSKGKVTLVSSESITLSGTAGDLTAAGLSAGATAVDVNSAINSVDLSTADGAQDAIRTADFALSQLNSVRGSLGAVTNRLESTISNLQSTAENLSASESRIRDADFAKETAALTRAQILQQAGTAILAQANIVPQAALALLR